MYIEDPIYMYKVEPIYMYKVTVRHEVAPKEWYENTQASVQACFHLYVRR